VLACAIRVGLGVAALAGCAQAPAPVPVRRATTVTDECAAPPPAFPDASGPCVAADVAADAGAPEGDPNSAACALWFAHGRELFRDDQHRLRVFEACGPENRYRPRAPREIDQRRAVLVRTGPRLAEGYEIRAMSEAIITRMSDDPEQARPPLVATCSDDIWGPARCIDVELVAPRPDFPRLAAALEPLFATAPDACVPLRIRFGVLKNCPPLRVLSGR
jgi:hypothetical protein